jgi:coenzyme F420-reducing hydrogenase delta subunit/ferredoxin
MTASTSASSAIGVLEPQRDGRFASAWRRIERGGDGVFGARDNPLRQLGGLGFVLFWLIAASGAYLYVFFDTSVEGAHASIERLTVGQWWLGGVMRSLHRYGSDAFAAVIVLHLVRELLLGRFRGFRWFSWVSGVPTLWLALACGVIGYWLVWDRLAQFVAIGVTEWFGALPGFGPSLVRNFIGPEAMTDRLFSLLVFLHIGVPLLLLLAMWAHMQRLTRPATTVSRRVALSGIGALLGVSAALPAVSLAPADLDRIAGLVPLDWFYLAVFPAVQASGSFAVWAVVVGLSALLLLAPWIVRSARPAAAVVDPDNCNGCTRCFADCPYAAIAMQAHPSGRGQIAVVDAEKCAACGLCAGACPSSTPFRSLPSITTGIDLPELPVTRLRERLDEALAGGARTGDAATKLVVFWCRGAARPARHGDAGVRGLEIPCAGMLAPSFVDYALRRGADGVLISSCPQTDCEFRFGARWAAERLRGEREPRLREGVDAGRVRLVYASREDGALLAAEIARFRQALAAGAGFGAARERARTRGAEPFGAVDG